MPPSALSHSHPPAALSEFPALLTVRQRFPENPPLDLAAALDPQLEAAFRHLPPGARIAVAVGSRGIAHLQTIVQRVVRALEVARARPFIVPAMGSHGGGTPEGQVALLADYGITEQALGVPLRPSMAVRPVGRAIEALEVVVSVEALEADGVVLVNRVKPHTDFGGAIGSGLLKMLVVGLGKHVGAARFHAAASRFGHARVLQAAAGIVQRSLRIVGGIALIENQRHAIARVEMVRPEDLAAREPALCAEARDLMARLPFPEVDLLIVDRMGKNISGTGMDPAVIGRMIHGYSLAEDFPQPSPRVRRLFVRELTPESHGNAVGIGMADFTTARLVQAMDRHVTTVNALTALSLQGAKLPIYFDTDREVIDQALATLALTDVREARIVRIRDTLTLDRLQVSRSMLPLLAGRDDLETVGAPEPMVFDPAGNLLPL